MDATAFSEEEKQRIARVKAQVRAINGVKGFAGVQKKDRIVLQVYVAGKGVPLPTELENIQIEPVFTGNISVDW